MKYDFNNIAQRRHTSSLKWDVLDNELPMWVADMDFIAPRKITDKLNELVNLSNFGYKDVPFEYFKAFSSFWNDRHNFLMDPSHMIFSTGVVAAISSAVRKLTTPGEKVLVMEPCYNVFFNSIVNNGRFILSSDLIYKNNNYEIDFKDLEEKLKDPQVSLMILCNPQNPTGNIWSKEELETIGKLAYENNVVVLSDEIHCDIVEPGYNYIPFASVNETNALNSVTCLSASKCFSLAGLQGACVYVKNDLLRHKMWRQINTDECGEANSFVAETFITALNDCRDYLDELNIYIKNNKDYVRKLLKDIPYLNLVDNKSLYLIWIDVSKVCVDADKLCSFIRKNTGLYITSGNVYGTNSKSFVRINLATSLDNVKDGLNRFIRGIELFKEKGNI